MTGPAGEDAPARLTRAAPLTPPQRRKVALAALLPVVVAGLVLAPMAGGLGAGPGEVVAAALVYGGLVGLAAAFVAVDRFHARQCPRCRSHEGRGTAACSVCGYDLETRPRYACEQRHGVFLEPGLCDCGRRLQRLPAARGIGREVAVTLRLGGWLLAFLVGVALVLQALERWL